MKLPLIFLSLIFFTSTFASVNTLKGLVHQIVQEDLTVKQTKAQWESVQSQLKAGYSTAMPDVNLVGQVVNQKMPQAMGGAIFPEKTYSLGVAVSQPIYLGGRVWNSIKLREVRSKQARLVFENQKQLAIIGTLAEVIQLNALQDKKKYVLQSKDIQKKLLDITIKKRKRGNAKSFELDQSYAEFYSYGPRLNMLDNQILEMTEKVKSKLNLTVDQIDLPALNKDIFMVMENFKVSSLSSGQLVKKAYAKRKDYLAQLEGLSLHKVQKKINRGSHLPTFNLSGSWGYYAKTSSGIFDKDFKNEKYSLDFKIPLFSGLSSLHERRADEKNIYSQNKKIELLKKNIKVELVKSHDAYAKAKDTFKQSQLWKDSAYRALISGEKNYKSGFIQQVQLVQLQLGFERASSSFVDARLRVISTYVNLAYQMGEDLERL
ncbi:MAG: TolC family protein [Bdellovibrionaceae bacterium]|jgi:outer membrane protein TolC|nr:TolC family protein [Pseudobdellovibrionaceae bacterium]